MAMVGRWGKAARLCAEAADRRGLHGQSPLCDAENPGAADESATPGFLFTGESLVPLGSVCVSRRAGSHPLSRATRPCDTVSLARDVSTAASYLAAGPPFPNSRVSCSRKASDSRATSVQLNRPLSC